jgi:predicted metal-dependent hydrolase
MVGPRGRYADLEATFDKVNADYFGGVLAKPALSWSAKRSRYILGRYDSIHNTIYVSRVFDSPQAPSFVLEYILFHEMLHVKHKTCIRDCRVLVHTPEFKKEERSFARYREAKLWLKGI